MKLFSWFIKANRNSKAKQEQLILLKTVPEDTVYDEVNTFNNNTMWPIAKVKTTTMIIKKPSKAIDSHHNIKQNKANAIVVKPSFLIAPLAQE
jgi:hypothetical protein